MADKSPKQLADDFFKLNPDSQAIALRYLENKLLGKTKENAEIKKKLGLKDGVEG